MSNSQKIISLLFLVLWGFLAIQPYDRWGWFLENVVIFITVPIFFYLSYRGFISNLSYALIFIFLALHSVGSHFAYDQVPMGNILGEWFGTDRNSYDRLVHLAFGLLWFYPIQMWLNYFTSLKGFWKYFLTFTIILSFSAAYEIFEWIVAFQISPEASQSFMGSQGDFWDTQKDMALASLGAILTLGIIYLSNSFKSRI